MIRICALFTCLGLSCFLYAQNLVPNPGFERYIDCPKDYFRSPGEFNILGWASPSNGTPDYFNSCDAGESGVPYNWAGVAQAFEGNGYVGFYAWHKRLNYREYIRCKLLEPLIKDSIYIVSFYFRLSSYSLYKIDRIGFVLSDTALFYSTDQVLTGMGETRYINDSLLQLRRRDEWEFAKWKYKAKGGEKFLMIGNFSDKVETKSFLITGRPMQQEMLKEAAYYYVDNVEVIPEFSQPVITSNDLFFTKDEVEIGKSYILNNIRFAFNSAQLLSESFVQLDEVISYLKSNQKINVFLGGHTDDQGNELYNLDLSKQRAKRVYTYLLEKGIAEERIKWEGFGMTRPLINLRTEEARASNRRVEITFTD